MKSIGAVFLGFILSLFVEGFSRIIISFFFTIEFSFFGLSSIPDTSWVIVVYLVSIISSWLGCMMTMTVAGFSPRYHLLAFLALTLLWSAFEIASSLTMVPYWYLFTFPFTSIVGIVLADYTYKLNQNAIHNP